MVKHLKKDVRHFLIGDNDYEKYGIPSHHDFFVCGSS